MSPDDREKSVSDEVKNNGPVKIYFGVLILMVVLVAIGLLGLQIWSHHRKAPLPGTDLKHTQSLP